MSESNGTSPRIACATLLTGESYLEGALVLGFSLRQNGWTGETFVLVTPNIGAEARQQLTRFWDRIIEVENITNPHPRERFGLPVYGTLFTKLRIWEQDEYARVIYIDSDAVVLGNLDALKEAPAFAAAPCMWTPDDFNAGVLVVEPSRELFADMVSKISELPSHDGSDQGFLNNYFPNWFCGPPDSRLPAGYNVQQFHFLYAAAWNRLRSDLKILHFTGPKPWRVQTRLGLKIVRFWLHKFTKAPRTGQTPFETWWELRDAMRASLNSMPATGSGA